MNDRELIKQSLLLETPLITHMRRPYKGPAKVEEAKRIQEKSASFFGIKLKPGYKSYNFIAVPLVYVVVTSFM